MKLGDFDPRRNIRKPKFDAPNGNRKMRSGIGIGWDAILLEQVPEGVLYCRLVIENIHGIVGMLGFLLEMQLFLPQLEILSEIHLPYHLILHQFFWHAGF